VKVEPAGGKELNGTQYLMKMTPHVSLPAANTSCPKSSSSVRRIRRSLVASRITSPSCAPGERSATARTS
jgi:hypothetical protein